MAILYGIVIAALMVGSAFSGFILCMHVRKNDKRPVIINPLMDDTDAEIERRAFDKAFNIEEPPKTPSGFAERFNPRTASEKLVHGSRKRTG